MLQVEAEEKVNMCTALEQLVEENRCEGKYMMVKDLLIQKLLPEQKW